MQEIIDLTKYTNSTDIILSGRPKGEELRRKLDLTKKDQGAEKIMVVIPQQVRSLNSSFFLGLFTESVQRLGAVGFREKYNFDCRDILLGDIERGITQALNTSNPLGLPRQ